MVRSPTGIIPAHLNTARDLPAVIQFLRAMPCHGQEKQELLFAWARNVGLKIRRADYESLME
jgi:hypothetical protein